MNDEMMKIKQEARKQRKVEFYYLMQRNGLSHQNVADILDCPPQSVKNYVKVGLAADQMIKLKEYLKLNGFIYQINKDQA